MFIITVIYIYYTVIILAHILCIHSIAKECADNMSNNNTYVILMCLFSMYSQTTKSMHNTKFTDKSA